MKRYPAYKDSGVEWIGEIPEHWEIKRLKYGAALVNNKVDARNYLFPYTGLENIESWTGKRISCNDESSSEGQASLFCYDDVLFGKLRPYLAKVWKANNDGMCTGELLVLRPLLVRSGFLAYYLLSKEFISIVDSSTYGAKMPRASWDFISNLPLLVPDVQEQSHLESYLDHKTHLIDTLIAKKQRQIELLQEQRAAIINQAVTKGLDPSVPMKESGVPWLGEVPEDWKNQRLKFLSSEIVDCKNRTPPYYEDGECLVVRTSNVRGGKLLSQNSLYTDEEGFREWTKRGIPKAGDVMITREAPAGEACLVPAEKKLCLGQRMMCIRPNPDLLDSKFLLYAIYSSIVTNYIAATSFGSTVTHIRVGQVFDMQLIVPPLDDQKKIADFIESNSVNLDHSVNKLNESITALQEYRTALISEVVTGKIDVREEVITNDTTRATH